MDHPYLRAGNRSYLKKKSLILWWLGFFFLSSCAKYAEKPDLGQPAYLRVFNDLNYVLGPANSTLPSNEMTFLMDPVLDKTGLPTDASIIGDYITVRDTFAVSYPASAGNIGVTNQKEWPGSSPVLTASTINGLNLSSWAQVPSGKHRIMLMGRPLTDTPFMHLPASGRTTVIADTTVDLTAGEVYTLEAVIRDFATNATGAYMRKENFTHIPFSTGNNYLSFYCLSGANLNPGNAVPFYGNTGAGSHFFPPLNLYYSLYTPTCSNTSAAGTNNYSCKFLPQQQTEHVYFRTITTGFAKDAPYDSLAQFPLAEYLNPDGTFTDAGNTPFVSIGVYDQLGGAASIDFGVNPNHLPSLQSPPLQGLELPTFPYANGLAIATSNSQQITIYPSVNIIELINGNPYIIQLHRTFDAPIITN